MLQLQLAQVSPLGLLSDHSALRDVLRADTRFVPSSHFLLRLVLSTCTAHSIFAHNTSLERAYSLPRPPTSRPCPLPPEQQAP